MEKFWLMGRLRKLRRSIILGLNRIFLRERRDDVFELEDEEKKPSVPDDPSRLGETRTPVQVPVYTKPKRVKGGWHALRRLSQALFVVGAAMFIPAQFKKDSPPPASTMLPQLAFDPIQIEKVEEPYDFSYRGRIYTVEPLAEYELYGLVVTHNNISGIEDAYHNSDSVDMKDICVLWGKNVADDNFHQFSYWSEPWTCRLETDSSAAFQKFSQIQISNNHLLASDEKVQEKIRSVRRGDQIHFKGKLVSYFPAGDHEQRRKTSLVRTDTGNGACEVVFVDEFEILRRANSGWHGLNQLGQILLCLALGLGLLVFLRAPLGA